MFSNILTNFEIFLVDGGWGDWSPWSKCDAKCPKTRGEQIRTRKCDNPAPSIGGRNCVGKEKEKKTCKIGKNTK